MEEAETWKKEERKKRKCERKGQTGEGRNGTREERQ